MKFGITGYKGYMGRHLLQTYPDLFTGLDCDVTDLPSVRRSIHEIDGVLHLACKSDVAWCEKLENRKVVDGVNLWGLGYVCHAARNLPVILLSSDHVFGGIWGRYREKDKINPINYYGFSKAGAEGFPADNLKIIRTSFLFDRERLNDKLANLMDGTPQLYPTFIIRTFQYLPHFASNLVQYIKNYDTMPKMLHLSGSQNVSWHELITQIGKKMSLDYKKLILPKTQESANATPRPYNGGLNTNLSKKLKFPQYSYRDGIDQMLKDWK